MTDHRTLEWAIDILSMCKPIRCDQGGMWFGRNHNFADATFVDYGAADAFAVAAKALPDLVKTLQDIIAAWDVLKHGNYTRDIVETWLEQEMKPAIETARTLALPSQDGGCP